MTKYCFFADCGGRWLCEVKTGDDPQELVGELAHEYGVYADEITWEQAEGTVNDFDKFFPSEMTPGEKYRFEQIQEIETLLNGANVPTMDGNTRLTISQRVKWLTSLYNQYEGRFLCPSCNQVWED